MADINNDGLGDIYLNNSPFMTHNPAPAVFIQDQTGKFTKKNNLLPSVLFSGRVFLASHFFDFDNDGDQDLFLGGADGRDEKNKKDVLLINEKGVLRESSFHLPDRLEDHRWGTVSVSSSDLNNDGYQDLVLSVHNAGFSKGKLQILMNSKGQKFTEIKVNLDFKYESSGYWIPWTAIGDLNNDGFDDIVFSVRSKRPTGYRPIKILLSDSGKEFNDISKQSPAIDNHINGVHLIDFNNDKFLDILITTYSEKYYIYENMKKW